MRCPSLETAASPISTKVPSLSLLGAWSNRKSRVFVPGAKPSAFEKVSLPPGLSVRPKGVSCAIVELKYPMGRFTGVRALFTPSTVTFATGGVKIGGVGAALKLASAPNSRLGL